MRGKCLCGGGMLRLQSCSYCGSHLAQGRASIVVMRFCRCMFSHFQTDSCGFLFWLDIYSSFRFLFCYVYTGYAGVGQECFSMEAQTTQSSCSRARRHLWSLLLPLCSCLCSLNIVRYVTACSGGTHVGPSRWEGIHTVATCAQTCKRPGLDLSCIVIEFVSWVVFHEFPKATEVGVRRILLFLHETLVCLHSDCVKPW